MKQFDVTSRRRIWPDVKDDRSITLLSRFVEGTSQGIMYEAYEADQMHADIIVKMMGLQKSRGILRAKPHTKDID